MYLFIFSGSNCLAGCIFVISDYQECMDHDILDTWMDVSSTLTNTNRWPALLCVYRTNTAFYKI